MADRYFLDRDNDGHWFIVRADRRVEWELWLDHDAEGDFPDARRLSRVPSLVTFTDPEGY